MRYTLLALLFISITCHAQDIPDKTEGSVEKSVFNVQTGFLGFWASNEARLSNTLALKSEVGFDVGFYHSRRTNKIEFLAAPLVNIEPRWYYNIKKRADKGRTISNNSANFVGVSFKYLPDWFTLSKDGGISVVDQVFILPKWSIKRSIAKSNFTYETGFGIGWQYIFLKQYGYSGNVSRLYPDIHLRIGYSF